MTSTALYVYAVPQKAIVEYTSFNLTIPFDLVTELFDVLWIIKDTIYILSMFYWQY